MLKSIYLFFSRRKLPCLFRYVTGYYCPGCGGSHAAWSLINGHPFKSFLYHPGLILFLLFFVVTAIRAVRTKRLVFSRPQTIFLVSAILIQWIVKDVMLYLGTDLISVIDRL